MEPDNNKNYNEPLALQPPLDMEEPNAPISVYNGAFILKAAVEITVEGEIYFQWLPNAGIVFKGLTTSSAADINTLWKKEMPMMLIIGGQVVGECLLLHSNTGKVKTIKGTMRHEAIVGDRLSSVHSLQFCIPNLRDFYGEFIEHRQAGQTTSDNGRITLLDDRYTIVLDRCADHRKRKDALKEKGGFMIQYAGEITPVSATISFTEMQPLVFALQTFLSFLNGRRTSPVFIHGMIGQQRAWCDYSARTMSTYKYSPSWPPAFSIAGLDYIWIKWMELWSEPNDQHFLSSAIHWYLEANMHSGFAEGSIIMAQTGLELVYNWLVVEQKQSRQEKRAQQLPAAHKIRQILSLIQLDADIPDGLALLKQFAVQQKVTDGPEMIVQIRNTVVHSKESKRKMLLSISSSIKYEAVTLSIYYLELALLYILNYQEKFVNRCSTVKTIAGAEQYVPWSASH